MLQSLKFDFEKCNWSFKWANEDSGTRGSATVPSIPEPLRKLYEELQYHLCIELHDFPTQLDARLCSFSMNQKQIRATFCITVNKKAGEYVPQPYNLDLMPQKDIDIVATIRKVWENIIMYFIDNMEEIIMVNDLQSKLQFA